LMALAGQMPAVSALALLETATNEPVWKEVRKLAGAAFETGTQTISASAIELGEQCLANRENLLRWLDAFSASLGSIRAALVDGDGPALTRRFEQATRERDSWLRLRATGNWDEVVQPEIPKQSLLQPFFGGLWPRKPRQKSKS
jgi:prephenate dehydrogenase